MDYTQSDERSLQTASIKKTNFLPVISGLFVGILVLSNILAAKIIRIGPLVFDGGTFLFPLSYIFGDVLGEVYGYKASRKVIWTGFLMLALTSANIWLVSVLPSTAEWNLQGEFDAVLLQVPRITAGGLFGYFAGEYSNSVLISKLKVVTAGRHLWLRTITSTLVGEFLDSLIFVTVAFAGLYDTAIIIEMIFSNYIFKTAIEVLFTPITYKIIGFIKGKDGCDVYDYNVNYNPLPVSG